MRYVGAVFKAKIGIRGRILSIALAPCLALLVTWRRGRDATPRI
ncbi:hypothetical protein ACIHDR_25355 [Nocardia sp. NPDC052278]|jgi:hypothetical protein